MYFINLNNANIEITKIKFFIFFYNHLKNRGGKENAFTKHNHDNTNDTKIRQ